MRILLHVEYCAGLCMVHRLQQEGHDVLVYIKEKDKRHLFDGIVEKARDLSHALDFQPDVIMFDNIGTGKLADDLRVKGYNVVGAGKFNDKLEINRGFALGLMNRVGINIPPTYPFKCFEEAKQFIQENPDRYVIKMDDQKACFTSYVGKSPEDLLNMIEHFTERGLVKPDDGFILQKFIEGYECSIEGWFNGNNFIPSLFNHCIEEKKFLVGGLGTTTGSEGSLVYFPKYENLSKVLIDELMKMTGVLRLHSYKGAIDLNTIVDKSGQPWALEYCARVGYICLENFMELFDDNFGEMLYKIGKGEDFNSRTSKDMCIGVNLTVPPYPIADLPDSIPDEICDEITQYIGARSYGLKIRNWEKDTDHIYFTGVSLNENNELFVDVHDGDIAAVCGRASTIDKAKKLAYDILDRLEIPDKQYRIDIGDRGHEWFKMNGIQSKPTESPKNFKNTEPLLTKNYALRTLDEYEQRLGAPNASGTISE